jgi:hypothetical protein
MVRVDRLYLGPMSASDQLGSDKFKPIVVLGRDKLPETAVFAWLSTLCAPLLRLNRWNDCRNSFAERKQTKHPAKRRKRIQITRKTQSKLIVLIPKKEE